MGGEGVVGSHSCWFRAGWPALARECGGDDAGQQRSSRRRRAMAACRSESRPRTRERGEQRKAEMMRARKELVLSLSSCPDQQFGDGRILLRGRGGRSEGGRSPTAQPNSVVLPLWPAGRTLPAVLSPSRLLVPGIACPFWQTVPATGRRRLGPPDSQHSLGQLFSARSFLLHASSTPSPLVGHSSPRATVMPSKDRRPSSGRCRRRLCCGQEEVERRWLASPPDPQRFITRVIDRAPLTASLPAVTSSWP